MKTLVLVAISLPLTTNIVPEQDFQILQDILLSGLEISNDVVYETSTRSSAECNVRCAEDPACVSCAFHKLSKICRIYGDYVTESDAVSNSNLGWKHYIVRKSEFIFIYVVLFLIL